MGGGCFNPSKCSASRVSRPKTKNLEFEYTLKGKTLANVSSTPYLGVCLSETLEWGAHINTITSKANSTLGFLRRNLKACLPQLRETASAARFVTQNYRQTASVTSLIQNLGRTILKTRRKNSRLVSIFKILNELVEIPINDCLILADRKTRGGHNQAYKHFRANTTLGQTSFWHQTIPEWNSFPAAAIEFKTVAAFKSQLVD